MEAFARLAWLKVALDAFFAALAAAILMFAYRSDPPLALVLGASVVMFYMLPEFMEKLEPQVLKRLKPGTRLVAHDYPFPNLKPEQVVELEGPNREHTLYMWTVPEKK